MRRKQAAPRSEEGSLANDERTRFDLMQNTPMTDAQIAQVEVLLNAEILANAQTTVRVLPIEDRLGWVAQRL